MKQLILIFFLVGISACSLDKHPEFDLIIANVNLIDGAGSAMQNGVNVYIKDHLIQAIDSEVIKQGEHVIDATGKYLMPGLFDCHVHTNNYSADFPRLIHFGVTSVFIPGGGTCTDQYFEEMRDQGSQDSIPAPRVFHTSQHFTLEGRHPVKTYSSSNWQEGESVYFLRDTLQIERLVKKVAQQPIQGIKLTIEEGPYPPLVERMPQVFINKVSKEALKNGTAVFAHVSDNIELQMAIEAGIKNLLHFTGVDLDFERDKTLVEQIYHDSISWVTTLMLDKSMLYPNNPDWIEQSDIKNIYDPEEFEKIHDPAFIFRATEYIKYFQEYYNFENPSLKDVITFQVEDLMELYKNGVNLVLGTDTGNDFIFPGHSLHEEMQLLELGGMKPLDIIKMGTLNAAKMMKVDQDLGSIEVGKKADLILLDKNPLISISNTLTINAVIKNGEIQKRIIEE